MNREETTSRSIGGPMKPSTERRSFIWKTGAAFTALFAAASAGASKPTAVKNESLEDKVARLSDQLGVLGDMNAIRKLHHAYGSGLDRGAYDDVINLFADDGEARFNGGVFLGKNKGVRRLFVEHFGRGLAENRKAPIQGFLLDHAQQEDIVEVAPDRQSAKARFHCIVQSGVPVESNSSLLAMARLQGQGIAQWWEGGVFDNTYVKEKDVWKISRLDYRAIWQADYALGRSYARPACVRPFSKTYPDDPTGPDMLIPPAPDAQAETEPRRFLIPHPMTRELWNG
ncbi:MAG: nuclear transport factor 2 family protein [Vicinamibacteria bacterium]|nr:nuclear transport factor 2 family protein [Vicinamibacteria bacterium]